MKKSSKILFIFLLFSLVSCMEASVKKRSLPENVAQEQISKPKNLASILQKIDTLVQKGHIPSMSIAIIKDGKIVIQESFGWANKEEKVKATPQTVYALGSLSKSITATGLMALVEKGEINLDNAANTYLSPLKINNYTSEKSEIKIWHLLNMCAGIPHGLSPTLKELGISKEENFNRFANSTIPRGKVFAYSNFSYGIPVSLIHN